MAGPRPCLRPGDHRVTALLSPPAPWLCPALPCPELHTRHAWWTGPWAQMPCQPRGSHAPFLCPHAFQPRRGLSPGPGATCWIGSGDASLWERLAPGGLAGCLPPPHVLGTAFGELFNPRLFCEVAGCGGWPTLLEKSNVCRVTEPDALC